mgnify:CR=1 FL=1
MDTWMTLLGMSKCAVTRVMLEVYGKYHCGLQHTLDIPWKGWAPSLLSQWSLYIIALCQVRFWNARFFFNLPC